MAALRENEQTKGRGQFIDGHALAGSARWVGLSGVRKRAQHGPDRTCTTNAQGQGRV